jgi:hypothetical protein
MGRLGKKRLNPYSVKTAEIIKFRGITDENELANADDAYASGMTNVESFRIRALSLRSGQIRVGDYAPGAIHAGGSFPSSRCVCVGSSVFAEGKVDAFSARAKKYPWRTVEIPTEATGLGPMTRINVTCKDIPTPAVGRRRPGFINRIVTPQNWMDCFLVTCLDIWNYVGDVEGYERVEDNASKEFDMGTALDGGCYKEEEEEEPPEIPPFEPDPGIVIPPVPPVPEPPQLPPLPPLPPTPPTWPGLEIPEILIPLPEVPAPAPEDGEGRNNNPCNDAVVSFAPHGASPIVITLVEGYSEESLTFSMSAVISSGGRWEDQCGINAVLKDGGGSNQIRPAGNLAPSERVVLSSHKRSVNGTFSCAKSGKVDLTLTIKPGYTAPLVLSGSITSWAMNQSVSTDFKIYVCAAKYDLSPNATVKYDDLAASLGILGSFPTVNDYLDDWDALELVPSEVTETGQSTATNRTIFGCKAGALNVSWRKSKRVASSFAREYTIPTLVGGSKVSGVFTWIESVTDNGITFVTENFYFTYAGGGFCCGWYSVSDPDEGVSISSTSAQAGTAKQNTKSIERSGIYNQGETVIVDFGAVPSSVPIPSGYPGTRRENVVTKTISSLKFLVMEVID